MPELGPNNDGIPKELKVNNVPLLPEKAGPEADGEKYSIPEDNKDEIPVVEGEVLTPEQYDAEMEAKGKSQKQNEDDKFAPKNGSIDDNKTNSSYNAGMGKESDRTDERATKKPFSAFGEYATRKNEGERERENCNRKVKIASILVKNSAVVGGGMEPQKSQATCKEILGIFNAGYPSVKEMESIEFNSSRSVIQKDLAKNNLDVLGEAGLMALSFMYRDYDMGSGNLPTSGATAEEIDDLFPVELKGIGKHIKEAERKLSEEGKREILQVNKIIDKVSSSLQNLQGPNPDKPELQRIIYSKNRNRLVNIATNMSEDTLLGRYGKLINEVFLKKSNIKDNSHGRGDGNDRVYATYAPPSPDAEDGGGGRRERGISYGPEKKDFVALLMLSNSTDFRRNMPPAWFNEASKEDQDWYEMAAYMADYAETKTAFKDSVKGLEKLWFDDNVRLKLNEAYFLSMYERDGFRWATQRILNDLCDLKPDYVGGPEFLYLKPLGNELKINEKMKTVEGWINDADNYKNEIALVLCKEKAYEGREGDIEEFYKKEINEFKREGDLSDEEAEEVWKEIYGYQDAQIEVGTAWNFLYNVDFIESADFNRELKPLDGVRGDTVNFIFHPEAKVNSKTYTAEDKSAEIEGNAGRLTGKEEVKGGPLVDWYLYQLENNPTFRQEYMEGKHRFFPKRLGISFLDTYVVKLTDGKNVSLAEALRNGKEINKDLYKGRATKWNMYQGQKDLLEGSLGAFKYLTGEVPLDGKDVKGWSDGIRNAVSLLRQQEGKIPSGRIPVLSDPNFYAGILYASFGLDQTDELMTVKMPFSDYKEGLRQMTMKPFIRTSENQELNRPLYRDGPSKFQTSVFDLMYKNYMKRTFNPIFRK